MNLTGTKIGCNEGGCGACTVVLGSNDKVKGKVFYKAVNSCIVPLISIDGKHLITVEGLGTTKDLHPIQERLAKFHGSQCGFCTPGIIMSAYALLRNDPEPKMHDIIEALDGNLCRCTGYITIIHSLITFAKDYDPTKHSLTELSKQLTLKENNLEAASNVQNACAKGENCCKNKSKDNSTAATCGGSGSSNSTASEAVNSETEINMNEKYFYSPNGLPLKPYRPKDELPFPTELLHAQQAPVFYGNDKKVWIKPATKKQLLQIIAFYKNFPNVAFKLVSGSSEFQVEAYVNPLVNFQALIYINDIPELNVHWNYDPLSGLEVSGNFSLSNLEEVCENLYKAEQNSSLEKLANLLATTATPTANTDVLDLVNSCVITGKTQVFKAICQQLKIFAGRQIRNAATASGNIVTASPISDLNPCLVGANAVLTCEYLNDSDEATSKKAELFKEKQIKLDDFFVGYRKTRLPSNSLITKIFIPNTKFDQINSPLANTNEFEFIKSYKQSKRKDDDISIVTACLRLRFKYNESKSTGNARAFEIIDSTFCYGGMAPTTIVAKVTSAKLNGSIIYIPVDNLSLLSLSIDDYLEKNNAVLESALSSLSLEFNLPFGVPGGMSNYRRCLTISFFYKFFQYCLDGLADVTTVDSKLSTRSDNINDKDSSGNNNTINKSFVDTEALKSIHRQIATGSRDINQPFKEKVVGGSDVHMSGLKQVTGEAIYTEDMPIQHNELHGALVKSTKAHAKILSVDWSEALSHHEDIVGYLDINDIAHKDENLWGNFNFGREEFFADGEVKFYGQTIGVIVGKDRHRCYEAAKKVRVEYEELESVLSIEDAIEVQSFFPDDRITEKGDWEKAFAESAYIFEDSTRIGSQEQFYFETQNCLVIPEEDGELKIYASTQNPTETQEYASHITGIPSHKIVCRVKRLGGGFGGKETRSVPYTSIASLAAIKFKKPIRIALNRLEDMQTTGQRHPFLMKWKVGLDKSLKFTALEAKLYANAGWSMDLTRGVIDRAVFHSANCYHFPNAKIHGIPCKTNTISNTAFRTFGGVQGCYLGESIIYHICERLNVTPEELRERNYLYPEMGQTTTYKQSLGKDYSIPTLLSENRKQINFSKARKDIDDFNAKNKWIKRGLAQVPVMFGVSFGVKFLNQAGALVHVYKDGSVLVSHGGTEMGQGLHTKMAMIAAEELQVPLEKIFISETSTQVVANTSATAASASSDLNGMAVKYACEKIMKRLEPIKKAMPETATFDEIVNKAYFERVNLSANGFYKTPDINYEWGNPNPGPAFFYFTQGAASSVVEVDTLTGDWTCLRTDIKMDLGRPINQAVDLGQIEGAFVQGVGLMTIEQSLWLRRTGALATTGPGSYKIPGFNNIPQNFNVSLLYDRDFSHLKTVKYSKGIGEPPLILGMAVHFAIRDALAYARKDHGFKEGTKGLPFISPLTSERIRLFVGDKLVKLTKTKPKDENEKCFFVEA